MPSDDTGPESDVMKPTLRSAAHALAALSAPRPAAMAARVRIRFRTFMAVLQGVMSDETNAEKLEGEAADAGAAADVQDLPGDKAVLGRGKETHGACHV